MTAYDAAPWHDLFVASAGAAAALVGLLVVAVSINVKNILESPGLPSLAARSIGLILGLLLLSLLTLFPGQSRTVLGVEILALGIVLVIATGFSVARSHFPVERLRWTLPATALALVSTAPMVVAGATLLAGAGGGLYWAGAELIVGFAVAIYNAWILLIEILR
jgi:hypothetical protein